MQPLRTGVVLVALACSGWTGRALGKVQVATTKVWLRQASESDMETGSAWVMEGAGEHWVDFDGNVSGLRFSVGQQFAVEYINELEEPTIIHAHGLTPPQGLDGVPFVDAPPIQPGRSVTYIYDLAEKNGGSYWLHSHYGFHHELGLALPVVVDGGLPSNYPRRREIERLRDVVMFMEDFCAYAKDEPDGNPTCTNPHGVYEVMLETWKEDSQDFNFSECVDAAEGTDTWDVGYRHHFVNHKEASDPAIVHLDPGEEVRLRLINGADTTNYFVDLGNLSGTLIATDGQPCHPLENSSFWVAVAQRMDIILKAPSANGAYPIFSIVEGDGMDEHILQSALVLVVGGERYVPPSDTYSTVPESAPGMMRGALELKLKAWNPLREHPQSPRRFVLNLTGDNGFMAINNGSWQLPPEAEEFTPNPRPLLVQSGERVCVLLRNFNGDSHPFHLHGHHFEVTKVGEVSIKGAMRDVVMVDPGDCYETEICFDTDNPGVWPFHCHMSFHLAAGMLTTVEYVSVNETFLTTVESMLLCGVLLTAFIVRNTSAHHNLRRIVVKS